jgi:hypothetical protein
MATLKGYGFREKRVGDLVFDEQDYKILHKRTREKLLQVEDLAYDRLAVNTIYFGVPYTPQDCVNQTGLAADSVGVKFASEIRYAIRAKHLKKLTIRATWTATHPDSVTKIKVIGSISGEVVSMAGNTGTHAGVYVTTGWTDGEFIHIEVEVTVASATAGATTDLVYAIIELEYGIR